MKLKKLWRQPPRSYKYRSKTEILAPDGVPIRVAWDKFVPGASVFVPCLDVLECLRQANELAKERDWSLDFRTVIEGGRWGVRIWRVL